MIPQGLVLLTSIAFAVGVIRLGRRQVLVKELPAIEGLARVDTVCFDKTGTLTEGKLAVHDVVALGRRRPQQQRLGRSAAADPHPNATLRGDPASAIPSAPGWRVAHAVPFSSARKWSGASFSGNGAWFLGAPDVLVAPGDGASSPTPEQRAAEGIRVLVLAWTDIGADGREPPARRSTSRPHDARRPHPHRRCTDPAVLRPAGRHRQGHLGRPPAHRCRDRPRGRRRRHPARSWTPATFPTTRSNSPTSWSAPPCSAGSPRTRSGPWSAHCSRGATWSR